MADQDQARMKEILPELLSNDFFAGLETAALAEIETELEFLDLPKETVLFCAGDPGDSMYFIARGMLEVCVPLAEGSLRLDVLEPGATVGETALLTGQPRSATVSTMIESEVIRLSRPGFERLAQRYPAALESFSNKILPRIQRSQLAAALASLFGPLDTQAVHAIQRNTTWRHLLAGEVLIRQGDAGDAMYIVINGRLRMMDDADPAARRVIGDVVRGETVGEFALLTGEPRSASVYAVRDTDVAALTRAYMDQLIDAYPRMVLQMTRAIVRRSQAQLAPRRTDRAATTILTVIPATSGLPLAEFSAQLAMQLSTAGETLYLSSARFDELFGHPGAAYLPAEHLNDTLINSWLSGIEAAHRFLVFEADPTLTEWTRRCLRQADRIVLVAVAGSEINPALNQPAFQTAFERSAPDLALIQPASVSRPAHTAGWLSRLAPRTLNHLHMGASADFSRLARRLTGRAVGLVLSGGGVRGAAHVGAIRALQEAGQEIDLIGGTSMGALIGAAYAMDWSLDRIHEMVSTFSSPRRLLDYTLPYTSLVASHKATKILQELYGEVQIEDLWRSYFCLSTNLSRAEPVIHQTGSLWEALRASSAIPGIFAPLLRNRELLVDGGVMNNFPVDVMRERCEGGYVIGVNTSPKQEKPRDYAFGAGVTGWQVLWSKINPFAPKVRAPSILSSLIRAAEVSSIYRNATLQNEADLLISPAVGQYASLDFDAFEQIIEQGYLAARAKISRAARNTG